MLVERIYDGDLAQAAWLIGCQKTKKALIIDPQRDISRYVEIAAKSGLTMIIMLHISGLNSFPPQALTD